MAAQTFKVDSNGNGQADAVSNKQKTRMAKRSNLFIVLAVIFLVLGIGGLCVVCAMFYATKLAALEYGIVFDAGSSHTSMYLYKWDSEKINNTGKVEQVKSCEVDGKGLSGFMKSPSDAGSSLKACLEEAVDEVPWAIQEHTPVYLGATAGMRIIQLESPDISSKILSSVREALSTSEFQFDHSDRQARILTGKDEGIGLWVTVNYIAGTLGNVLLPNWSSVLPQGVSKTVGVLDLGGASTQVAFAVPNNVTLLSNETEKLTLFSKELRLFSNSFLCFGAGEMRKQLLAILVKNANYQETIEHPCFADGHNFTSDYEEVFESICTRDYSASSPRDVTFNIYGTGTNAACDRLMVDLFNQSSFAERPGPLPTLPDRIVARGGFAYALNDLEVLDESSQANYTSFISAMNAWCAQPYHVISKLKLYDPSTVCANAHYINHLLSNVYKIPAQHWAGISFVNKINGVDMGWTLGYMTNITSALPRVPKLELYKIGTTVFIIVTIICSVLIILGIAYIVFAVRYRRARYRTLHQLSQPF